MLSLTLTLTNRERGWNIDCADQLLLSFMYMHYDIAMSPCWYSHYITSPAVPEWSTGPRSHQSISVNPQPRELTSLTLTRTLMLT